MLFFAEHSEASKKKKFPPYPDVWGYDLMDDFSDDQHSSFTVRRIGNGDYVVWYPSKKTPGNTDVDYTILSYFGQEKRKFKRVQDAIKYFNTLGFKPASSKARPYIVLNKDDIGGEKIIDITMRHQRCFTSMRHLFISRLDRFDQDYPSDYEVLPIGIATSCDDKNVCNHWAYNIGRQIIKLEDDTFFLFDSNFYLLLRFDKDFKTKFKPQHKVRLDDKRELQSNFYVLPRAKVEYFFDHVAKGDTCEYTDDMNGQFLDYLYDLEQGLTN
ncbi:MAG: hypothetical protein K0R73_282 [Candidatus Midichloriaceae bacterium]|jgi:hypothetical protein|nr:hypothetical protein [Candidatus Midichloriaceae bacterium]